MSKRVIIISFYGVFRHGYSIEDFEDAGITACSFANPPDASAKESYLTIELIDLDDYKITEVPYHHDDFSAEKETFGYICTLEGNEYF